MNRNIPEPNTQRRSPDPTATALRQTHVVVVTYNPNLEVLRRQFARLDEAGVHVVIIDNNSRNHTDVSVLTSKYDFGFIALEANEGVASAHNRGIEHVKSKRGRYLVFLDQDSIPEADAFSVLIGAYLDLSTETRVGAVGSSYTLQAGHAGSSFVCFGWFHFKKIFCALDSADSHEVDFLISSGTLIPVSVIEDVGSMREELFIDHVDTDWFLRAKSRGYRFFGCCASRMSHALGERTVRIWLGRWRTVPVHKGFRYFFMFRNSLWLYRQPYAPAKWVSADAMRLIYILLFSGIFVAPRLENIAWMAKGTKAGLNDIEGGGSIDQVLPDRDLA